MDSISNYKNRALDSLKGNWADAAISTIIYSVLIAAAPVCLSGVTFGFETLWTLAMIPLEWGFAIMFLLLVRGEKLDISRMFDGYKDFLRIFCTMLLQKVYIFLWSLLLIIPGIIKAFSYAMTSYILKDNPEIKNNEAIEKSMQMMQGHKMDLFLLYLSFIGWAILSVLTLGIGFIFLTPYVNAAVSHFYEDLKEEAQPVI